MTWQFLAAGPWAPAGLVLTWLVQSTALLVAGLLAGFLLRRRGPAVQSALYRTTLAAVILCPIASVSMAAMGFSGLLIRLPVPAEDGGDTLVVEPVRRETPPSIDGDAARYRPDDALAARASQGGIPPIAPTISAKSTDEPKNQESIVAGVPSPDPSDTSPRWADVLGRGSILLMTTWLMGAAVLGVRLAVGHRRMAQLRSSAIHAEPDALALCRDLARQMRLEPPSVLRSPFLCSPCLDGVRRPAILLPEDAEEHLRETFIHELAHLERRDGLWNFLRHVATAVFWMQPLLWLLSKRLEATAEEVCDDYVVEFGADRCRYAGHLLELAERRLPPLAPSGVGMVSLRSLLARRIARILDSTRTLSTQAGRRAIAATLLAGLAGTLLVGSLGVGGGSRTALGDETTSTADQASSPTAEKTPESADRVTVNGRVVDPDGRPVAGATVVAARYRNGFSERQELDRSTTDREGRFRLTFEDTDVGDSEDQELSHPWGRPAIVAWAPGFGPAWPETLAREVTEDKPLRLARDGVPIAARVVDLEGRPVAGATVRVHMIQCPKSPEVVDRWLEDVAKDSNAGKWLHFPIAEQLPGCEPSVAAPATTDRDGRFRLTGLGRDRLAILDIRGESIAFRRVQVVTRLMKRVENPGAEGPPLFDHGYYGAEGTIVVEPGQVIEGVVRDAESNEPIPGAVVGSEMLAGSVWGLGGLVTAQADSQGRYRLVGLPKGNGHVLHVDPPLDRPYFPTSLTASTAPGLEPVRFDITLRRGLWITGRLTDGKTGRPAQAAIHYYPFFSNALARAYPNFQPNSISFHWTGNRYRTDAEGRFRVVALPGRGIVAAKSFDRSYRLGIGADTIPERPSRQANRREALPTYNQIHPGDFNAMAGVDPPNGIEEFRQDLALQPTPSLTVHLVDPEGKPLTYVTAWGRFPHDRDFGDNNLHDRSRTEVSGLDPAQPRTVVFLHRDRKLGAVLVIKPGEVTDGAERTVTLRPCATVTGRIADAEGKPVTGGIRVRLMLEGDPHQTGLRSPELHLTDQFLDGDGRFRIDDLPPGGPYVLEAANQLYWRIKPEPEAFKAFEVAHNLKAEPGQVIALGTFNAATGKPVKEPEKPATENAAQDKDPAGKMPITGRIVDLEGRPVAGASVQITQITKPKGDKLDSWIESVKRGEPPWIAYNHLIYEPPITPEARRPTATTDAQGRFRLDGIEAERVVYLSIQGPTIGYTTLDVVTRQGEPFPAKGFPSSYGSLGERVYGADFTYTAAPGRPIEGVVRDAATNQPLAGVQLVSEHFAGAVMSGITVLKTTTDAQGRFRLVGMPKGAGNKVTAVPNDDQPYFLQHVSVPDPPGMGPVQVDVALHKGLWIEGKVTEKQTGEPVPGAWLHYFPFLENTFAQATPEFDRNGNGPNTGHQDRYQTKSDGTYRIVGLPGRAILGVLSHSKKPYLMGDGASAIKGMNKYGNFETWRNPVDPGKLWPTSMKEINPAAATPVVHLDFQLNSGEKVLMRAVDLQGKPVTGLKLAGRIRRGRHEYDVKPEAEFDVVTLAPDEDRMVLIRQDERKLGKVVHVKPGDDKTGPVMVTLEPMATIVGRIVDADGNPVSGATIRTDPLPGGDFSLSLGQVATDKEGQFVVPDVPIGCKYTLVVESGLAAHNRRVAFSKDQVVQSGKSTDVGEIRFTRD
jgi:beta-lactamase regulating signal transducer with metallopeptidase domain/protocatechuate 3,4-dioxygenase beta subunit